MFNMMKAAYKGYRKLPKSVKSRIKETAVNKIISLGRKARSGKLFTRRKRSKPSPSMGSSSHFNTGYTIVNRKARSNKRRKVVGRRRRGLASTIALMGTAARSINLPLRNEIELQRGRVLLPNMQTVTPTAEHFPGGWNVLPCCLLELDKFPNMSSGDVPHAKPAFMTLAYDSATSCYGLMNRAWIKDVVDGEATATNQYTSNFNVATVWKSDTDLAGTTEKAKIYQKGYEMDLLMYGQTNQDTLYRVDVVRMDSRFAQVIQNRMVISAAGPAGSNSTVHAIYGPGSNGNADQVGLREEWNQFWLSYIAPYTMNPTYKPRRIKNRIKIVRSYKFKIPEASAEFDRVQCVKTRIRIPTKRILRKNWKTAAVTPAATNDPEDGTQMADGNQDAYHVSELHQEGSMHPAYTHFLIIRATNNDKRTCQANNVIQVTPGQDPTFDIDLKVKYLVEV